MKKNKSNSYISQRKNTILNLSLSDKQIKDSSESKGIKLELNFSYPQINIQKQAEITSSLLEMGYKPEIIKFCYEKYNFKELEDFVIIVSKDEDNSLYNHHFYSIMQYKKRNKLNSEIDPKDDNICFICNDTINSHPQNNTIIDNKDIQINSVLNIPNNNYNDDKSSVNLINNRVSYGLFDKTKYENEICINNYNTNNTYNTYNINRSLISTGSKNSKDSKIKINPELINKLEKEFKSKENLCIICFANELNINNSTKFNCGHCFCNECIKYYITNTIHNGQCQNIKCLMAGCLKIIDDDLIQKIIPKEVYQKYIRFKKRDMFMMNNKNGLIPCVFPDCEEWVAFKREEIGTSFVQCILGHKFCAICKQNPHPKKRCQNVIL